MAKQKKTIQRVPYLTKRMLIRKSSSAIRSAADDAMSVAGHVVKAQGNWIVRENQDGSVIRLAELGPKVQPHQIILD